MAEPKKFELTKVAGGAAPVLFAHGMKQVVENILDVNRDPKGKRKLTLTFEIEPNQTRDEFSVEVSMSLKMPGLMKVQSHGFISRREREAYLNDVRQEEFELHPGA